MKNLGDVFQLSQGAQTPLVWSALRLILCTRPAGPIGVQAGRWSGPPQLNQQFGGVKNHMLPYIIGAIIGIVIGLVAGIPVGIQQRKKSAEREIGSAEEEAKRIVNDAYKSAECKKRVALVKAKVVVL